MIYYRHKDYYNNEGDLQWIDKNKVTELKTWEGDKMFVEKVQNDNNNFIINSQGEKI